MSHIKSYSHPMSMLQFHSRCLQTARSIEPSRSRMWPMQLGSHRNDWKSYETHLQRKEFEGIRYVRYMYSIMYYRQTMKNMYIVWCILYIYCRYSIYIYIYATFLLIEVHLPMITTEPIWVFLKDLRMMNTTKTPQVGVNLCSDGFLSLSS